MNMFRHCQKTRLYFLSLCCYSPILLPCAQDYCNDFLVLSVRIHGRVAAAVVVLRTIAHSRGVAPTRLVTAVVGTRKLPSPFFNDTVIGIGQDKVGSKVAIIPTPSIVKTSRVVIHLAACPRGNAREPRGCTTSRQIVLRATTHAENISQGGQISRQGCALIRRTNRLNHAAKSRGIIETRPIIRVQVQRSKSSLRMSNNAATVQIVAFGKQTNLLRKQIIGPIIQATRATQASTTRGGISEHESIGKLGPWSQRGSRIRPRIPVRTETWSRGKCEKEWFMSWIKGG